MSTKDKNNLELHLYRRLLALFRRKRVQGLSFTRLSRELGFRAKDKHRLKKILQQLEREKVLIRLKRRYFLNPRVRLVKGRFTTSGKGYGFLIQAEKAGADVFIPERFAQGVVEGDVVEAIAWVKGPRGRAEGKILGIVQRKRSRLIGEYQERAGQGFILPFDMVSEEPLPVQPGKGGKPKEGMIIAVDRDSLRIREVFGFPDDPGVDRKVVIERYSLRTSFPRRVREEAEKLPASIPSAEYKKRRDLRHWVTVTIDGAQARDFDDAVSLIKDKGDYLLGVHIADVSYYVTPGSALDREAYERSTSVYFSEATLPMLPERLSNFLCSLRPQEDKLTMTVLLRIDPEGRIKEADFFPSLIRTAARLTYDSVYKIFQGDRREREKYQALVPTLLEMRRCARLLRRLRVAEGSLDFDLIEPELVYQEGEPISVMGFETNEAHHLIEDFMLAANEAVATFLTLKKYPLLYRVHPRPSVESLERLKKILAHLNISLPPAKRIRSQDLQRILDEIKGRPEEKFVQVQILRSLKLAVYSDQNVGHFGLGKELYTHFTSPIRRYPDLVVHRILKRALAKQPPLPWPLPEIGDHCSERERRAEEAERDLLRWRIYRLLKEKLGEEMLGMVVDITPEGLVVELQDYFVDGFLPYEEIPEPVRIRWKEKAVIRRRGGPVYELGDIIKVVIALVDPFRQKMRLALSVKKRRPR